MKKFITLLILAFVALGVNAQISYRGQGELKTVTADTLNGNETVNFVLPTTFSGENTLTIQALCTNIGGTSDGTLILEASLDGTSYETITETTGLLNAYPNDTLTIVDGAVVTWVVYNTPWKYYRIQGAGTASDTTLITPKYMYK